MVGQHTRTAIATGTCVTLGLALAVTLGAVPRQTDNDGQARAAAVSSVVRFGAEALHAPQHVTSHPRSHARHTVHSNAHLAHPAAASHTSLDPAVQSATSHVVTVEDAAAHLVSAGTAKPATTKPTTKQPAKKHHKKAPKKHHKKTAPAKPTAPKKAARTKPSAGQLASAITGLKKYVHTVFSITTSEVDQFGDQVCSAFDKNESYASIKSQISAKVKQLPFTTVTAGAADYVVRTAVKLFCPGYTSRTN
ncbi:MAG TPA: hypothetical protein VG899_07460 [Mycobacteriales bacterium]|nr:hypothetical protein [Mycobacteriales bacterium]